MSPRPRQPARLAALTRLAANGPGAARTPFVLLIVVLLGSGLLGLLLLNASLNQGSFELSKLKKQSKLLSDERQELQGQVDGFSAPDALDKRARELGLVPGGVPAFLKSDGGVVGVPEPARPDSGR
ncbi:septum formation initiator family protein [Streptomyces tardus]|uniref:septum formation initiator family protein n=1 Tax=Streptomyces tardus TaxID=2780544 RepID=UPI001F2F302E|nr:septum formation initiator family protein [Streptomyces tardus]